MPRPEKFTAAAFQSRVREHIRELYPEYVPPVVAPPVYDPNAAAADAHHAEMLRTAFDRRVEKETKHLSRLAAKLIPVLGLAADLILVLGPPEAPTRQEVVGHLAALLREIQWEWKAYREIQPDPSLPVLGGIQPTHGQMRATLNEGLNLALKLRRWSRDLPAALLLRETVPMTMPPRPDEPAPALGVVIERLADTLAALAAQHKAKPGQQPGQRHAAQFAARWLILFMDRHAPEVPIEKRRAFLFLGLRGLGIRCPDLTDDPGDYNTWFAEAEAYARPQPEPVGEGEPADDNQNRDDDALLRSITAKDI